ncbi:hypothetical protein [Candidatus Spongiihabitans sp.]|uniref:hypothetical protein n=1 Tax=Candidatus Spongiihabitans sp. TaxID=3101308 RepID=UPI003C7D61F9
MPPHPVIARLVPGNPVNNCHAQRDSLFSVALSSQKESSPSGSPLTPHPVIARNKPGNDGVRDNSESGGDDFF